MNSLRRMLDILDLFKPEQPVLDIESICAQLGYAPASAYRYVRELGDVGLLVKLPRGYALGPRIIELDRQMTEYDPLIVRSRDLVDHLVAQTGLTALVSELYGATVINILHRPGAEGNQLNFGRGRPMALFRSATSKVILAYLLPRQLRRLYDQHARPAAAGAGLEGFFQSHAANPQAGLLHQLGRTGCRQDRPGRTDL